MNKKYKTQVTKDDATFTVEVKDGNARVKSSVGYSIPSESLLFSLKDNGNGYYVKTKNYSSVNPDHIFNLDYLEIEYLYYAYKAILESEGRDV